VEKASESTRDDGGLKEWRIENSMERQGRGQGIDKNEKRMEAKRAKAREINTVLS
jgi:hypothetical protein